MTPPLRDVLALVDQEVFRLREAWQSFRFLFALDKRHVDILNAAGPGFFGSVQRLMFDDVVLRICRLTDPAANRSQENLTLQRLLRATDWKTSDAPRWSTFTAKLASVDLACADCRSHRNKRISHVDLAWSTQALTLPDATLAMVDQAVSAIEDFFEAMYGSLNPGVSRSFDLPAPARDSRRLIEYLANRASQKTPDAVVVIRYTPGSPNAELCCPFCGVVEWLSFYPDQRPINPLTTRWHFDRCYGVVGFERVTVKALDVTHQRPPLEFAVDLAIPTRETDTDP